MVLEPGTEQDRLSSIPLKDLFIIRDLAETKGEPGGPCFRTGGESTASESANRRDIISREEFGPCLEFANESTRPVIV